MAHKHTKDKSLKELLLENDLYESVVQQIQSKITQHGDSRAAADRSDLVSVGGHGKNKSAMSKSHAVDEENSRFKKVPNNKISKEALNTLPEIIGKPSNLNFTPVTNFIGERNHDLIQPSVISRSTSKMSVGAHNNGSQTSKARMLLTVLQKQLRQEKEQGMELRNKLTQLR